MLKSSLSRLFATAFRKPPQQNRSRRSHKSRTELLETRALLSAGALDTTFGAAGTGKVETFFDTNVGAAGAATQADGMIIVVGNGFNTTTNRAEFAMSRYTTDGRLDLAFYGDGKVTTAFTTPTGFQNAPVAQNAVGIGVAIQNDGKIVVVGYTSNGSKNDFAVARYNYDGSLDTTFDGDGKVTTPMGSVEDIASTVAIQADGRIVVGGYSQANNALYYALARYNTDGSLDAVNDGTNGKAVRTSADAFDNDGKLVDLNVATQSIVTSVAIVRDPILGDKILAAGRGITGNNEDFAIVRYRLNGTRDSSFGPDLNGRVITPIGSGNDLPAAMAIQTDGKIVLAGYSDVGGAPDFSLARYSALGVLDDTFGPNHNGKVTTPIGSVSDNGQGVAIQPDGKIVVSGYYVDGGNVNFALVRYTVAGTPDQSFDGDGIATLDFDNGSTDVASDVELQSNGRIVVVGYRINTVDGKNVGTVALAGFQGNSEPTNLTLSSSVILENLPVGTVVGTLTTTDPDVLDTFTYSLVSGTGSTNNASFRVVGNQLQSNAVFDFDVKSSYSIRLRTTDQSGGFVEKAFTIKVNELLQVLSTSLDTQGIVLAGSSQIVVSFNKAVVHADVAANFELRRAGTDGLLLGTDSVIAPSSVVVLGKSAILTFPTFVDDTYRLIVKDAITDTLGNALDGDQDRTSGGNWRQDFVGDSGRQPMQLTSNGNTVTSLLGGNPSYSPSISSDGRFVAFRSYASNLVTGDTNGSSDVFVKDLSTGVITLVSSGTAGIGNSDSESPSISSDGQFVAFYSSASNLVTGDTNGTPDIFVKDLSTGVITLVSSGAAGIGNKGSYSPSISSDGRFVAFQSNASNLVTGDTNGKADVFVKNLLTGDITLVSSGAAGIGNGDSQSPAISSDGESVAFFSYASNLVTGDTNGTFDVFVKNLSTGVITLVSSGAAGIGNSGSYSPSISSDGQSVAFMSDASNLVTGRHQWVY